MNTAKAFQKSSPSDEHRSVAASVKNRGRHNSNIWIFQSPKNRKILHIQGDIAFMHIVLLEGDPNVSSYEVEAPAVYADIDGEMRQTKLDAIVHFMNGQQEWWEFKRAKDAGPGRAGRSRAQLSAQAQAASIAGVRYRVLTEKELSGKEYLFNNWLTLCAAMTRAMHCSMHHEEKVLLDRIRMHHEVTLGSLLEEPATDPALMLAVVATLLQRGVLKADLENSLFGAPSLISRSAS